MPYTNLAEVLNDHDQALLVLLTDRADPPAGVVDSNRIQEAVDAADEIIDGYLKARYQLPLNPIPKVLKGHAQTLSIYYLYSTHPAETPAYVMSAYDRTVAYLRGIAKGDIRLAGEMPVDSGSAGSAVYVAGSRTFDSDSLRNY
jgi:phage gp36-like protein